MSELVKRFHSVGHRYWHWAYSVRDWKQQLKSEAILCAVQCQYLSFDEYPKEANRRIRILLRQLGLREKIGIDVLMSPMRMDVIFQAKPETQESRLRELEKMYQSGLDYSAICAKFKIYDTEKRIEIRSLLRKCFSRI